MYKVFRYLGIVIIVSVVVLWCLDEVKEVFDQYQTEKAITEIFLVNSDDTVVSDASLDFEDNILSNYMDVEVVGDYEDVSLNYLDEVQTIVEPYLGYISFPRYGVKRLIVNGTDRDILDQGLVGMFVTSVSLDSDVGNVVLAGHSADYVFQSLHDMDIGEEIQIGSYVDVYTYRVTYKYYICDDDFSYFDEIVDRKVLTLVTCTSNEHERLIVRAELV